MSSTARVSHLGAAAAALTELQREWAPQRPPDLEQIEVVLLVTGTIEPGLSTSPRTLAIAERVRQEFYA